MAGHKPTKVAPAEKPAPAEPPKSATVTVKVLAAALAGEGERTYLCGETFTTTPARAAALGRLVEPT